MSCARAPRTAYPVADAEKRPLASMSPPRWLEYRSGREPHGQSTMTCSQSYLVRGLRSGNDSRSVVAYSPEGTTALYGFGQSIGYLLASAGPVGFGILHDASGGSTWPLIALLCTLAPMLVASLVAVRDWKIEDDLTAR